MIALLGCGDRSETSDKTVETKNLEYYNPTALIEAAELKTAIDSSDPIQIIDFRDAEDYLNGHIPTAININRIDVVDTNAVTLDLIADRSTVEEVLQKKGISADNRIIIYDDKASCYAARLWWVLNSYGLENISLLNGGYTAWINLKQELERVDGAKRVELAASDFRFPESTNPKFVDVPFILEILDDKDWIIVDARSIEEYTGT
ncbi:MAG: hypothetical protein HKN22_06400, partial [Bacteroidia bacterium]|nr:hypothetical protein [Bacteroidia bacterium]